MLNLVLDSAFCNSRTAKSQSRAAENCTEVKSWGSRSACLLSLCEVLQLWPVKVFNQPRIDWPHLSHADGKTTYSLTASEKATEVPSRISLRVGSQSPSALTGRPALSSHWLRGTVHRDCSSDTGLKHTITWDQAAIKQAWSAQSPALLQVICHPGLPMQHISRTAWGVGNRIMANPEILERGIRT